MLEAIASDPAQLMTTEHRRSLGYSDSYIPDLMIDYRPGGERAFAWISYNFHKTYPSVIWGLKLLMADELFDVPAANLAAVPLHDAFGWAYAHFILEDVLPAQVDDSHTPTASLTRQVLHHAAALA